MVSIKPGCKFRENEGMDAGKLAGQVLNTSSIKNSSFPFAGILLYIFPLLFPGIFHTGSCVVRRFFAEE